MAEITFLSNKTRKEINKLIFALVFAVITWVLQVSLVSRFVFLDTNANLLFLATILFGLLFGGAFGITFGIIFSYLSSSVIYNHVFYISYPLIGLIAGFLKKSLFSDEMLLFLVLTFLLTPLFELLNCFQFSHVSNESVLDRLLLIGFYTAILNLLFAPIFYLFSMFITKKLNLR